MAILGTAVGLSLLRGYDPPLPNAQLAIPPLAGASAPETAP